jgi:hypothetical protein
VWLAVASLLTLFAMSAYSLLAQSAGTAAVAGVVTDPSGAAIPNVTVTLTSNETGQVRTATTGNDGVYRFTLLPPGSYRARFAASGFKTAEVAAVTLNVTETPQLNRTLEVGQQTEQVTVEASAETLQTQSSTLGTVAGAAEVTGLPLSNRNYTQILSLSAGANAAVNDARSLGKGTQDMSVNGNAPGSNNFQMDGVAINNVANAGSANDGNIYAGIGIPSPDAIQEFKVQTSTYDASYGRNPGGNVNVLTKSGTNQFHGTAFEFFRNSDLNANDFFYNRDSCQAYASGSCPKQVLNLNQFGGVIGGPIKKDKLFFFGSYQGTREKNGVGTQGNLDATLPPIPGGDRSTAAFASALAALNCKNFSFGPALACDGSNVNPVALKILNLKLPNGQYYFPGSGTNALGQVDFSVPALYNADQTVVNGDYLVDNKNTLAMRYFYTRDPQTTPLSGNLPGNPSIDYYANTNASIKLTTIISNTFVNELRGSVQRNVAVLGETSVPNSTPADLGITPLVPGLPLAPGMFIFTQGYTLFNTFNPSFSPTTQMEVADQISWSHGKHTIRAGFEYEKDQWNIVYQGFERGWLWFGTFNDFLVGQPGNIFQCIFCVAGPEQGVIHGYRIPATSAFAQDDYKVSSRLTFNIGVRWEYDGALSDKYGSLTNVWLSQLQKVPNPPTSAQGVAGNLVGYVVPNNYSTATWGPVPAGVLQNGGSLPLSSHPPYSNFAPRIGFAEQIASKLVLRGGVGLFYDRIGLDAVVHAVEQGYPYSGTGDYGAGNQQTLQNPFPVTPIGVFAQRYFNPACLNAATAANPTPCNSPAYNSYLSAPFLDQDLHTPLVRQYNLNLQYEFIKNWVLEMAYVGSSGINLIDQYHNYNTAELATPGNPINGQTANTLNNVSLRVPYLGYQPVGLQGTAFDGKSNYNSLQVTLRKNFSHGFLMQASYTYSKDLSDINYIAGAAEYGANYNDPHNLSQQYGPVRFNRPERFVVNYSYDLPFGTHQGVTGKLLTGWNVSGVTTLQNGTPLTITDPAAGTIYGTTAGSTAQLCPGQTYSSILSGGSITQRLGGNSGGTGYFSPGAFCAAPTGGIYGNGTGFGNSGNGIVLGPGQFNWDISIVKTTRITEKQAFVFRTEFFNAFNHAQFNNPVVTLGGTLGEITSTSVNPRILQFAVKYIF